MPKLPIVSGGEAVKIFCSMGYHVVRQRGSHIRLHHDFKKPLTIPNHKVVSRGLLRTLIRDAGISVEEFCKLADKI
jgi:predicted RNA binding protein YcfA (HicA-like mRNA interferase family)